MDTQQGLTIPSQVINRDIIGACNIHRLYYWYKNIGRRPAIMTRGGQQVADDDDDDAETDEDHVILPDGEGAAQTPE